MYSPKIKEEYIKRLYLLAKARGVPMTQLVNKAIENYIKELEAEDRKRIFR